MAPSPLQPPRNTYRFHSRTFDVANRDFTASGPVRASTGKLVGATGSLTLSGNEDFPDGSFTKRIWGNICVTSHCRLETDRKTALTHR